MSAEAVNARRRPKRVKPGFVEKTLAGITGNIEQAIFSEESARQDGFLQRRDPRAKMICFVLVVVATAMSRHWEVLLSLYGLTLAMAVLSRVDLELYLKRVWLGFGLFSAIVVLPSVFFVGHKTLVEIPLGLFTLTIHSDGVWAACIFVLRVGTSVSLAILLILTTKWADILKSLRVLKVPSVFVLVLAMTYRYVFLLLHTANGMFLARKSRIVGRTSGQEERWWVVSAIGVLMNRSFRMSEEVYQAMLARGFTNEIRTLTDYRMAVSDWLLVAASLATAALAVYAGQTLL